MNNTCASVFVAFLSLLKFLFCVDRYPGKSFGAGGHREALPAGLLVLHLLWKHQTVSGVLGLAQRLLFSSWTRGITSKDFEFSLAEKKNTEVSRREGRNYRQMSSAYWFK